MDPIEFARLQAVEQAAAALLARKGAVTRSQLAAALATPAPDLPPSDDVFDDAVFDPSVFG